MADTGTLFLIVVGPFVGSFIVTLANRWTEGPSILTGRSACRSCTARLAWFDLIPVLSWIVRRGCCGSCAAPIGPMYPLTELAALAIGIWAATQFGRVDLFLACLLGWTLLALAVIDLHTMLLPDILTLPVLVLGLFVATADGRLAESLIGAALGFAVFALIATVYRRWRRRDGGG
ncbi:MAG: prepilin peptidase, partial [Alphaproteobacteria bacterium]|nr:prepilin peptidase [Alphaproteobacteria bacterium]